MIAEWAETWPYAGSRRRDPDFRVLPLVSRRWSFAAAFRGLVVGLVVIVAITRPMHPALRRERQMGPTGPVNLDSLVA